MMNFIIMTVSFTLAILLAGVISTVALFALMTNAKAIKWLMNYYMKMIQKSLDNFEEIIDKEELGA